MKANRPISVIWFGIGSMCQELLPAVNTESLQILAFVDERPDAPASFMDKPVIGAAAICEYDFDYIFVSCRPADLIMARLRSAHHIPDEKLVSLDFETACRCDQKEPLFRNFENCLEKYLSRYPGLKDGFFIFRLMESGWLGSVRDFFDSEDKHRAGKNSDYAVVWPGLPTVNSERQMLAAMERLPLLRKPRSEFDPGWTAVVCHASDLERAIAYYHEHYSTMPPIYVEGGDDEELREYAGANKPMRLLPFTALRPGMDIQLFCLPVEGHQFMRFQFMGRKLHEKGFVAYGVEDYPMQGILGGSSRWKCPSEELRILYENYNALADPFSRYTYLAVCKAFMTGELGYIPMPGYPQYRHPQVSVEPGDVLCEGGIFNGKTTERFYRSMQEQGQGQIFAFEPGRLSIEQSHALLAPYAPAVQLIQKALWSKTGSLHFNCDPQRPASAYVSENKGSDAGSDIVECVSIDDFFADLLPLRCIKLDVEGAELSVLQGGEATIRKYRPKLMISIYHRNGYDMIHILRWLRELDLGYRWYCGHHSIIFNETVLYGIVQ